MALDRTALTATAAIKRRPAVPATVQRSAAPAALSPARTLQERLGNHATQAFIAHSVQQPKAATTPGAPTPRALTTGGEVHLGSSAEQLAEHELDALLAHEAVHVQQQSRHGGKRGDALDLEVEAHALAPEVLAGRVPVPRWSADPASVLYDTPHDRLVVERAKKRLGLLQKYLDEYTVREGRRQKTKKDREEVLPRREKMDELGDPIIAAQKRGRMEEATMAALNRRPMAIDITDDEVRFNVRFEVRFDDPKHEAQFGALKDSLQRGLEMVWNQHLTGETFGGRKLIITPTVTRIASTAARNIDAWLITVRATDQGPVNFPGCNLPQPPPGDPTSVTEPLCAGGVMSIPPLHMKKPDVLGHELFHLFGFLDRYLTKTYVKSGQKPKTELESTRETNHRPDPLGAESSARALPEDLAFLFEHLGVYEMEENRGLATLRDLERHGLSFHSVHAEMKRLEQIIATGRDPDSLIPRRDDFREKIIKSAEDLD